MNKIIIVLSVLIGSFLSLKAQEEKNIADLDFLYQAIQQLPSFKDQLKNDKNYRQLYENLRKDLKTDDDFEVYQKLLRLIYPIKDNHLGFYRKPDSTYKFQFLMPKIDIPQLEQQFSKYSRDSLEGFYYNGYNGIEEYKYIVYKKSEGIYYLQSLKTNIIEAILTRRNGRQSFDVIRFLNPPVPYVLFRNVKFSGGNLVGLNFHKQGAKNFVSLNVRGDYFEYKKLEGDIGYLRLSSFSSNNENIKNATEFFNKTKDIIIEKKLIVDVRNNGGGGYKTSRQFINFLKNFDGKVYILQNAFTVSNAEQFILNLKEKKQVVTLGETTRGTITYGSNYGKTLTMPSNRFLFYPTDMSGLSKELAFESIGVKPDVALNPFTEDWIIQTLNYIKAN